MQLGGIERERERGIEFGFDFWSEQPKGVNFSVFKKFNLYASKSNIIKAFINFNNNKNKLLLFMPSRILVLLLKN